MQDGQLTTFSKPTSELARTQQLASGGGRALTGNALTRRAGGALALHQPAQPVRIVVDVREFMSQLPAVLHGRGLEVAPVTLAVRAAATHRCGMRGGSLLPRPCALQHRHTWLCRHQHKSGFCFCPCAGR